MRNDITTILLLLVTTTACRRGWMRNRRWCWCLANFVQKTKLLNPEKLSFIDKCSMTNKVRSRYTKLFSNIVPWNKRRLVKLFFYNERHEQNFIFLYLLYFFLTYSRYVSDSCIVVIVAPFHLSIESIKNNHIDQITSDNAKEKEKKIYTKDWL